MVGAVPWGRHFCLFYQTKTDLLDILVPYFKAGLENNEFCMWITAGIPGVDEARAAMEQAMPDFDDRLASGQIEIRPYTDWYVSGSFNERQISGGWVDKLNGALKMGYAGLRLAGDTSWLEESDWRRFADYEAGVHGVISKYKMLAVCTHSLDKFGAAEVLDVIRNHEFALICREGKLERVESEAYRAAREALLESERRYLGLVESLQEGIVAFDKELNVTYVNPYFVKMTGYATDEVVGQPLSSGIVAQPSLDALQDAIARRLRQPTPTPLALVLLRKDGGLVESVAAASPLYDRRGEFAGFVAGVIDVTERKRLEEETKEKEERFRAIIENAWDAVTILDEGYNVVYESPSISRITGYTPEEWMGMQVDQMAINPQDLARLVEQLDTLKSQPGSTRDSVISYRHKDGSWRWVEATGRNLLNDPKVKGLVINFHDITDRKSTEEHLRQDEARYRGLYNAVTGGIVVWDKDWRIVEANPAACEILGMELDKIKGRRLSDPVWEATREDGSPFPGLPNEEYQSMAISRIGEVARGFVMSVFNPAAEQRRWLLINSEPIRDSTTGEIERVVSTFLDITERRNALEELRRQRDIIEAASQVTGVQIAALDSNYRYLYFNRNYQEKMQRITGKEIRIGDSRVELFADMPEQQKAAIEPWSRTLQGELIEPSIESKLGGVPGRVYRVFQAPIRDSEGKVVAGGEVAFDITELVQTQEALQRSEADLKRAQEMAHVGSWNLDLINNTLTWSDEVYRIFGAEPHEFDVITYELFLDFVHPDDRAAVDEVYFGSVLSGSDGYEIEHRVLRRGGEIRFVHEKCRHTRNSSGWVVRSSGMVQDITERRWAEAALRESEERHRLVFEAAMDGFWVADLAGRLLRVNDSYCRMSGYARDELLGMHLSDLEATEKRDDVAKHIEKIRRMGQDRFETRHRRRDGKIIDVEVCVKYLDVGGGQLIGAARDIGEKKRAEQQLEAQSNMLSHLFDAVVAADNAGRVTYWNEAAEGLYGISAEEAIGRKLEDLYQEVWPDPEEERMAARDLDAKGHSTTDQFHLKKDGRRIHVRVAKSVLRDSRGRSIGFVSVIRDRTILWETEQKIMKLNEKLKERAADLEVSNKELEAFAYSVSHDLRTPLRAIDGFSLALLEDYAGRVDEKGQNYLLRVRAATQRMGQLIDDLLELSRVGRTEVSPKTVNLSNVVQQVARDLQDAEPKRHAEFVISPDVLVHGDPRLLRLVIQNLVGNAWKFSRERQVTRIEFGEETQDGTTIYYVKDNGIGFDMAYADKLFMPFQRLHSQREYPGTGIGLTTAKRIISRHRGRIWAEGKVDSGATFYFTLNEG